MALEEGSSNIKQEATVQEPPLTGEIKQPIYLVRASAVNLYETKLSKNNLQTNMDILTSNASFLKEALISDEDKDFQAALDTINYFIHFYDGYMYRQKHLLGKGDQNLTDDRVSAFIDIIRNQFQESIPKIEARMQINNKDEKLRIVKTVTGLLGETKQENTNNAAFVDFLMHNFEPVLRSQSLGTVEEPFVHSSLLDDGSAVAYSMIGAILSNGDKNQIDTLGQKVGLLLRDNDPSVRQCLKNSLCITAYKSQANFIHGILFNDMDSIRSSMRQKVNRLLEFVVKTYGLDPKTTIDAWQLSFSRGALVDEDKIQKTVSFNLQRMFEIEFQRPGIVKELNSRFGIVDFAKYPRDLLIAQYDERDKEISSPYGIIINSTADRNGAFYSQESLYANLYDQLKDKGRIIIFEASSLTELISILNSCRHNHGKISFAVIGGHGTIDNIEFSRTTPRNKLSIKDARMRGVEAVRQVFTTNPTIVLNACETGKSGGLAEEIAKKGVKVIAPDGSPEGIENMKIEIGTDGVLDFTVSYGNTPTKLYANRN